MHLALFRRAKLTAGETLLVHSGAGGLGSAALQLGAAAGARVLATAGSPEKVAFCEELGADISRSTTGRKTSSRACSTRPAGAASTSCAISSAAPSRSRRGAGVAHEGRYLVAGFSSGIEAGEAGLPMRPSPRATSRSWA